MQIKKAMVLIDRTRITCLHTSKNSTTCPTDMRTSKLTIIVEGGQYFRAPTTLKSEGEVTSLSGADKREVRDNREKW